MLDKSVVYRYDRSTNQRRNEVEHVRKEELFPFHKLTEEEQQTIERENCKGNVERLDVLDRQWY